MKLSTCFARTVPIASLLLLASTEAGHPSFLEKFTGFLNGAPGFDDDIFGPIDVPEPERSDATAADQPPQFVLDAKTLSGSISRMKHVSPDQRSDRQAFVKRGAIPEKCIEDINTRDKDKILSYRASVPREDPTVPLRSRLYPFLFVETNNHMQGLRLREKIHNSYLTEDRLRFFLTAPESQRRSLQFMTCDERAREDGVTNATITTELDGLLQAALAGPGGEKQYDKKSKLWRFKTIRTEIKNSQELIGGLVPGENQDFIAELEAGLTAKKHKLRAIENAIVRDMKSERDKTLAQVRGDIQKVLHERRNWIHSNTEHDTLLREIRTNHQKRTFHPSGYVIQRLYDYSDARYDELLKRFMAHKGFRSRIVRIDQDRFGHLLQAYGQHYLAHNEGASPQQMFSDLCDALQSFDTACAERSLDIYGQTNSYGALVAYVRERLEKDHAERPLPQGCQREGVGWELLHALRVSKSGDWFTYGAYYRDYAVHQFKYKLVLQGMGDAKEHLKAQGPRVHLINQNDARIKHVPHVLQQSYVNTQILSASVYGMVKGDASLNPSRAEPEMVISAPAASGSSSNKVPMILSSRLTEVDLKTLERKNGIIATPIVAAAQENKAAERSPIPRAASAANDDTADLLVRELADQDRQNLSADTLAYTGVKLKDAGWFSTDETYMYTLSRESAGCIIVGRPDRISNCVGPQECYGDQKCSYHQQKYTTFRAFDAYVRKKSVGIFSEVSAVLQGEDEPLELQSECGAFEYSAEEHEEDLQGIKEASPRRAPSEKSVVEPLRSEIVDMVKNFYSSEEN